MPQQAGRDDAGGGLGLAEVGRLQDTGHVGGHLDGLAHPGIFQFRIVGVDTHPGVIKRGFDDHSAAFGWVGLEFLQAGDTDAGEIDVAGLEADLSRLFIVNGKEVDFLEHRALGPFQAGLWYQYGHLLGFPFLQV